MAFTVVYDACVLYPAPLRDLLLRVGMTTLVRARWSEAILDECFRSILDQRPDLSESALKRTRGIMCSAVAKQAGALRRPSMTVEEVLGALRALGLVESVARLRLLMP